MIDFISDGFDHSYLQKLMSRASIHHATLYDIVAL